MDRVDRVDNFKEALEAIKQDEGPHAFGCVGEILSVLSDSGISAADAHSLFLEVDAGE